MKLVKLGLNYVNPDHVVTIENGSISPDNAWTRLLLINGRVIDYVGSTPEQTAALLFPEAQPHTLDPHKAHHILQPDTIQDREPVSQTLSDFHKTLLDVIAAVDKPLRPDPLHVHVHVGEQPKSVTYDAPESTPVTPNVLPPDILRFVADCAAVVNLEGWQGPFFARAKSLVKKYQINTNPLRYTPPDDATNGGLVDSLAFLSRNYSDAPESVQQALGAEARDAIQHVSDENVFRLLKLLRDTAYLDEREPVDVEKIIMRARFYLNEIRQDHVKAGWRGHAQ